MMNDEGGRFYSSFIIHNSSFFYGVLDGSKFGAGVA